MLLSTIGMCLPGEKRPFFKRSRLLGDIRHQIVADAAVMQQRIGAAGTGIADKTLALGLRRYRQFEQLVARYFGVPAEFFIDRRFVESHIVFHLQDFADGGFDGRPSLQTWARILPP